MDSKMENKISGTEPFWSGFSARAPPECPLRTAQNSRYLPWGAIRILRSNRNRLGKQPQDFQAVIRKHVLQCSPQMAVTVVKLRATRKFEISHDAAIVSAVGGG